MPINPDDIYDATIIGAGPIGLFAAFYAGLREMKTKIIEALPHSGGQLAVLYPEKPIYDVPGHPRILARDLVARLEEQANMFSPEMVFEQRVERLSRIPGEDGTLWELGDAQHTHYSRTVIIAAGIGAFAPNRLDEPGVATYEGRGVQYAIADKRPLRGRRVLIVGGGDTAVDWAVNLADWASDVTLIHRRNEFRAHESSVVALHETPARVLTPYELKSVRGDGTVEAATIVNNASGERRDIPVDVVLINIGYKAALGPVATWGMDLVGTRYIRVDGFMETSMPGIFAVGDIAAPAGTEPLNLLATGLGQAAVAANAAKRHIDPKSRLFPGHSSELHL